MKARINTTRLLAVLALLALTTSVQAFLVSDYSGNRVEVGEQLGNGRWTVIMLWQLNCVPCEQQKPAMEAFHKKYSKSSAHVVGLVMDGHKYMSEIKTFVDNKPTAFPSYVVFGDVFNQQILEETGKSFHTSPGYLVYSPDGELKIAIQHLIDIDDLIHHLESQFNS